MRAVSSGMAGSGMILSEMWANAFADCLTASCRSPYRQSRSCCLLLYEFATSISAGAKRWSYQTGIMVDSSPTVVNGMVYVGSDDWFVYALNA